MTGPGPGRKDGPEVSDHPRNPAQTPVFLERRSYRRRRLSDAARLLPLLGAALFAVPLLWPGAEAGDADRQIPTSDAVLYIFAVWAGLVVVNAVFGRVSRAIGEAGQEPGEG
ncbi:MAG: hypothetical protein ACK5MY_11210 [Jhaorihella sp.]